MIEAMRSNGGMIRRELIRLLVLREICDDYENVDQIILPSIAREGAPHGFTIERSEVVEALRGLVSDGLAKAYILSSRLPHVTELDGMPEIGEVEENFTTYFWATQKGLDFHRADDTWWPFADEL